MSASFATAAFLILIGGVATAMLPLVIRKTRRVRRWPVVEARIIEKRVIELDFSGDPGPVYGPKLRYVYSVNGVEYTGDQLHNSGVLGTSEEKAKKEVAELPEVIKVLYDPENPGEAYVYPLPLGMIYLALFVSAPALICGLLILIFGG